MSGNYAVVTLCNSGRQSETVHCLRNWLSVTVIHHYHHYSACTVSAHSFVCCQ